MAPEENDSLENSENSVGRLAQKLAVSVSTRMDRNAFFQILSSRLRELFSLQQILHQPLRQGQGSPEPLHCRRRDSRGVALQHPRCFQYRRRHGHQLAQASCHQ